jgi:Yip1 domain
MDKHTLIGIESAHYHQGELNMNLVDRAKNILLKPKDEWQVIAGETATVKDLYLNYAMILAAIPAIATFIGGSVIGHSFLGVSYRVPMVTGIAGMIVQYLLGLGSIYVLALVIDALAPNFGGEKNFIQAFKVAVFSATASWLAGIFYMIPGLGILAIVGLYSLYLLYVGLPVLMKSPADKAMGYTVVVIICAIVIFVIIGVISGIVGGGAMMGGAATGMRFGG